MGPTGPMGIPNIISSLFHTSFLSFSPTAGLDSAVFFRFLQQTRRRFLAAYVLAFYPAVRRRILNPNASIYLYSFSPTSCSTQQVSYTVNCYYGRHYYAVDNGIQHVTGSV